MSDTEEIIELEKERRTIVRSLAKVQGELSRLTKKSPERAYLIKQLGVLNESLAEVKGKILLLRTGKDCDLVSDHAIVRWLERKHGIDINKLRSIILNDALVSAIESNLKYWSDGEVVFVIDRGAVRTVIPVHQLQAAA